MEQVLTVLTNLRDVLSQHPFFAIGMILFVGYYIGKLAAKVKLPEITGFIVAGLILGPSVIGTGIVSHHMGENLKVVTELALSLIALTIGGEFYLVKLKRLGKEIVIITLVQIFATFVLVTLGLTLFGMELAFSMMLGAIAAATAPAATVAIVQSLHAKGIFIDYLYGIVALDDAGSVILFGVVFAIASGLLNISGVNMGTGTIILHAILEVALSLVIGVVSGFLLHHLTKKTNNSNEIMIISLGIIFITTTVAIVFHLSPLLANMAAGAVLINMSARNHRVFRILEPLTPPIYALFFVIAGAELDPALIVQKGVLVLGIVYIISRAIGKYGGVFLGSLMSRVEKSTRNNLGFCMLPQAGVAIGLVLLIQTSPMMAKLTGSQSLIVDNMVNIVLFSVFVNELIGPPLSKMAIIKGNKMEES